MSCSFNECFVSNVLESAIRNSFEFGAKATSFPSGDQAWAETPIVASVSCWKVAMALRDPLGLGELEIGGGGGYAGGGLDGVTGCGLVACGFSGARAAVGSRWLGKMLEMPT